MAVAEADLALARLQHDETVPTLRAALAAAVRAETTEAAEGRTGTIAAIGRGRAPLDAIAASHLLERPAAAATAAATHCQLSAAAAVVPMWRLPNKRVINGETKWVQWWVNVCEASSGSRGLFSWRRFDSVLLSHSVVAAGHTMHAQPR